MTMTPEDNTIIHKHPHEDVYCYCLQAMHCPKCGQPRTDRQATRDALDHILQGPRPRRTHVFGNGPLLVSDLPKVLHENNNSNSKPIILGIDEAGRGSVLGPMVYGLAYWSAEAADKIPKSFNDSKQLTADQRETLWQKILDHEDIGFAAKALWPNEISRNMLRQVPYNLNEQSHDTAMTLIRKVQHHCQIQTCYIDTVGNADFYKRKLEREFPNIEFVVESKADAKYAPCSAASVVAKVLRDRLLEGWQFSETGLGNGNDNQNNFGSGYPSDPQCKEWLNQNLLDPVFGYSNLVRFSWAPMKARLKGDAEVSGWSAVPVQFRADLDEDELEQMQQLQQTQKGMSAFLQGGNSTTVHKKRKQRSSSYFTRRKLQAVSLL